MREKMDKKKIFLITVFVLILIFGVGLYITKTTAQKSQKELQEDKKLQQKLTLVMQKYNYPEIEKFSMKGKEKIKGNEVLVFIKKDLDRGLIFVNYSWFEIEAYYGKNETIYCLKIFDKEKRCANIQNNTEYLQIVDELKNKTNEIIFPNKKEQKFVEYLIKNKIMVIDELKDDVVAEKPCKKIISKIEYKGLDFDKIEQLKREGIMVEYFGVGYIDKIQSEECFDYNNGITMYKKLRYSTILGEEEEYVFEVLDFQKDVEQFFPPKETDTMVGLEVIRSKISSIEQQKNRCLREAENKASCYFITAIDNMEPGVCSLLKEDKNLTENCYYQYAIRTNNPEICSKTGEREDYCYIDFVALNRKKQVAGYCEKINDKEIKQQCFELLNQNQSKMQN